MSTLTRDELLLRERDALRDNLREAWSALGMIREAVETLAPSGSVKAAENLAGPTFMHEAEALVAGIQSMSIPAQSAGNCDPLREALKRELVISSPYDHRSWASISGALDRVLASHSSANPQSQEEHGGKS